MRKLNITEFGAIPGGYYDNTEAFALAFTDENIFLYVPAGVWLSGPITISSGSTLHLEEGAVIKMIDDEERYSPVYSRWEGIRCWCMHPCIYAEDANDITISGSGIIDGCGNKWWTLLRQKAERGCGPETKLEKTLAELNPEHKQQPGGGGGRGTQYLRPPLVQFNRCRNVKIESVTFKNSPFWTIHPVFCSNVSILSVTIDNPKDSPNTDAIDIDSCEDVEIKGCNISVGDDAITLKSGNGSDGVSAAKPTKNVSVSDCTVKFAHGGAVIGSETAGGISNVSFSNCHFYGTDRGVRIKTRRGRGGVVKGLSFKSITIKDCLCPVAINMYYKCGTTETWPFTLDELPVNAETPRIEDVSIENMTATGCRSSAGFIVGIPESPVKNVSIKNCVFEIGENLVSTDDSEMFIGPEHTDDRGIRIINADVNLENVKSYF